MTPPTNGAGETPSHGPNESAARLLAKMRGLHGLANRARAQAEAERVLAASRPTA